MLHYQYFMLPLAFHELAKLTTIFLSVAHRASDLKTSGVMTFRPSVKVSTVSFMTDGKDSSCVYCT
jgi:hypothetical protein